MTYDEHMAHVAYQLKRPFSAESGNICHFTLRYIGGNISIECGWKTYPASSQDVEECNVYVTTVLGNFIHEVHDQDISCPKDKDRAIAKFLCTGIVPEGARIIKPKEEPSGN